ncbi:cyclin-dependent kinase inhibitor 3 [Cucumis melo var. makuwa]|uniref:Cyclin-dependent kinase inhibitor 3 n=2 Tax=Cucumis melo TaxID=3656 RepID=A0A5A7UBT3_CUCMM|nr:cyclin-dependent kinase inhibitor 3 [Cucumis melo var. makuwa]
MGKYFKKSKLTLMELSPHSSPPLRTRAAKTLALQRLNKSSLSSSSSSSSSSYLKLRSRRLQKPPILRQKPHTDDDCCRARLSLQSSSEKRNLSLGQSQTGNVWDVEDCFREFGGDNWGTAGKIHSSVARDSSTNETSHSTRMETILSSTKSSVEMELLKSFPTASDIEEFFAHEELWHQRTFVQKYNFDIASDMPLQGRYEWVKVVPVMMFSDLVTLLGIGCTTATASLSSYEHGDKLEGKIFISSRVILNLVKNEIPKCRVWRFMEKDIQKFNDMQYSSPTFQLHMECCWKVAHSLKPSS